jgi:predicted small metal-binding protein
MGKIVECAQVDPTSGCKAVIRGKDEQEVMVKAAEHARTHGLRDVTPELQAKVKAAMHEG